MRAAGVSVLGGCSTEGEVRLHGGAQRRVCAKLLALPLTPGEQAKWKQVSHPGTPGMINIGRRGRMG